MWRSLELILARRLVQRIGIRDPGAPPDRRARRGLAQRAATLPTSSRPRCDRLLQLGVEPGPHLGARALAVRNPRSAFSQSSARSAGPWRDDLDRLTILQAVQRHDDAVDARRGSDDDFGMNERRSPPACPAGSSTTAPAASTHRCARRAVSTPAPPQTSRSTSAPASNRLNQAIRWRRPSFLDLLRAALLVAPVRRQPRARRIVHRLASDLDLERRDRARR